MRAALFAYSRGGCATARRVLEALPEEGMDVLYHAAF